MGIALSLLFGSLFFGLWLFSARWALLLLVLLRTTIDAVGPEFPIIGIKGGFNTIELQEASSVVLLFFELVTFVDLLFIRKVKFPAYAWVGVVFVAFLFIGGMRTHSELSGYSECLRAVSWVMLIVILPQLLKSWEDIWQFVKVGTIAACVPLLGAIYSMITGYKVGAYYGRMIGLTGLKDLQGWHQSPPNLGILTASVVSFVTVMFVSIQRWTLEKLGYGVVILLSTYVVYRTYSRTSLMALMVFFVAMYLLIRPTKEKLAIACLGVFLVWVLAIKMDVITVKKQDFDFLEVQGESSIVQRFGFWILVWRSWIDSGWSEQLFGHGIHSVKLLTWGKSAHNDFFNMLHDNGLVPLLSYFVFGGLVIRTIWRVRYRYCCDHAHKVLVSAGLSLIISSFLIANTMRFIYSLSWMLYISTIIALCLSIGKILDDQRALNGSN